MVGMAEGLFLFLSFNSSPTTRVAFASKILREGQITRQRPKISFKKNKAISDSLVHPKKVTAVILVSGEGANLVGGFWGYSSPEELQIWRLRNAIFSTCRYVSEKSTSNSTSVKTQVFSVLFSFYSVLI